MLLPVDGQLQATSCSPFLRFFILKLSLDQTALQTEHCPPSKAHGLLYLQKVQEFFLKKHKPLSQQFVLYLLLNSFLWLCWVFFFVAIHSGSQNILLYEVFVIYFLSFLVFTPLFSQIVVVGAVFANDLRDRQRERGRQSEGPLESPLKQR